MQGICKIEASVDEFQSLRNDSGVFRVHILKAKKPKKATCNRPLIEPIYTPENPLCLQKDCFRDPNGPISEQAPWPAPPVGNRRWLGGEPGC